MAATERTPLTGPTDPPTCVEFAGLVRARRTKLRQFQCCVCAFLLAIVIMALVVTVSYSINETDPLVADTKNPEAVPPSSPSLKSSSKGTGPPPESPTEGTYPTSLTIEEWKEATKAGAEAIASRETADALATPLAGPSPNSRHRYAVRTSLRAGKLALGGIGELAATRSVEDSRARLGEPSAVGARFKNIWIPDGSCGEYARVACPPSEYRTFDGTCNAPRNSGAALTPFVRKLPSDYADGVEAPRVGKFGRSLPSAREISSRVHPPAPSANPSFTVMLAVFGQFLDHDITATAISQGTNGSSFSCCPASTADRHPECFPVEVAPGDPVYDLAGRDCMEFVRSAPAPQCKIGPRQQLNQVTAFVDASVIYGTDLETSRTLREGRGGSLRMFETADNRTLLPLSTDPNDGCNREAETSRGRYCFASGDGRANENLHLTTMHLLWARQHNLIASALSGINPSWDDEKIYQEARRMVGAQLQHIAYREFLPIILGEKEVERRSLKPLTSGFGANNYTAEVDPAIANSFAAAAFRFAHTLLPGLMRVTDPLRSTSSYVELHRMLFNPYSLYSKGGMESSLTAGTSNLVQRTSTHVTSQLTNRLFEDPLGNATIPCGLDLVSLNIQRGRDHGLPGYNAWRRYCGLGEVTSFARLADELDPEALDEISKIYDDVDDIDLYTGALAESDHADGLVGPTFRCIIGDQFSRIRQGDRFWYELPGEPHSFTEGQLKEIRRTSLAKLICDCSDGIDRIQPEVMRSVTPENPMTSCEDIVGPSFSEWKDSSSPSKIFKAAADMPETWLNFKTEINDTVREIVDIIGRTVPAPGASTDWTAFNYWIDKSFADVRSEVSALRRTSLEAIPDEPPSSGSNNEVYEKSDGLGNEAARFAYMRFAINGSLTDLQKLSKTAATQPTTYEDWINFKNDIAKFLNDALANATGTPTASQREELRKRIEAEIEETRSRIASVKTEKLYPVEEAAIKDAAAAAGWSNLKNDVAKAVTDALDRVRDTAPPPGDPTWMTFALDIKKQFAGIKDHISLLPTTKLTAEDQSIAAYRDSFVESLNESMNSAVAGIDGDLPAAGDPAWADFAAEIDSGKSNEKSSTPGKPAVPFDWMTFKGEIIKSVADTVNEIKRNMPPPGSPAWSAFRGRVIDGFANIPIRVPSVELRADAEGSNRSNPPKADAAFDWKALKNDVNKSVSEITEDNSAPAADLPTGDRKWAAFEAKFAKFNGTFQFIKSEIDSLRPKPDLSQFLLLTKDWLRLKARINQSLAVAIDSIKSNAPPSAGDPGWMSFRHSIENEFDALRNEIATVEYQTSRAATILSSSNARESQYRPVLPPGDLFSLQAKANETLPRLKKNINEIKLEATAHVISAADWIAFKQEINDAVANFVNFVNFTNFANARNSTNLQEWNKMKDFVEKSFADLRDQIASLRNATALLQKDYQISSAKTVEVFNEKKVKDLTKNGKASPASDTALFDWAKLKTDINATVQSLLDDLGKIVPGKSPSTTLKGTLVEAQRKFSNLQLSPSLTGQAVLPDDWAVFVNGINKTLSGVMKKIDAPKPMDKTDSVALESYERTLDDFFEEAKEVVEKKKSEFTAATSMASSLLRSEAISSLLLTSSTILSVWIIAAF